MTTSTTTKFSETAPAPLSVRKLKTTEFEAYKDLGSSQFDERTERLGRDNFEAAKVIMLEFCLSHNAAR